MLGQGYLYPSPSSASPHSYLQLLREILRIQTSLPPFPLCPTSLQLLHEIFMSQGFFRPPPSLIRPSPVCSCLMRSC